MSNLEFLNKYELSEDDLNAFEKIKLVEGAKPGKEFAEKWSSVRDKFRKFRFIGFATNMSRGSVF